MAEEHQAELDRIGRLIAQLRNRENWTQEDLAHELGSSVATVSRWERAVEPPSKRYRKKLAETFGIDSSTLIPVEPTVESQLDRIETELAQIKETLTGLSERTGSLTDLERDLLRQVAQALDRQGRDVGRGQPRQRSGPGSQEAAG